MDEHTHTQNKPNGHLTIPASETAERMANACVNFLETLTPALRHKGGISVCRHRTACAGTSSP